jgi:hypothetical protein
MTRQSLTRPHTHSTKRGGYCRKSCARMTTRIMKQRSSPFRDAACLECWMLVVNIAHKSYNAVLYFFFFWNVPFTRETRVRNGVGKRCAKVHLHDQHCFVCFGAFPLVKRENSDHICACIYLTLCVFAPYALHATKPGKLSNLRMSCKKFCSLTQTACADQENAVQRASHHACFLGAHH